MKEIKEDTDGEICHVFELEESTLWKWLHYPKQSRDLVQSRDFPMKFSRAFFTDLEQNKREPKNN